MGYFGRFLSATKKTVLNGLVNLSDVFSSGGETRPDVNLVFSPSIYTGNGTNTTIQNGIDLEPTYTAIGDDIKSKFNITLYVGTGAGQTFNTGVDLATNGGLVWVKSRNNYTNHTLHDTARGIGYTLATNSNAGQAAQGASDISAVSTTGFSIGGTNNLSGSVGYTYAAYTFRKATKFFDMGTYTGTGVSRSITHALGAVPGLVIVKRTDTTGEWFVIHNSMSATNNGETLYLNTAAAVTATATPIWAAVGSSASLTSTTFSLGSGDANILSATYVWYAFANDTSTTSIIKSGSFNTTTTKQYDVDLGWRPQFVLIKRAVGGSGSWFIVDTSRGWNPYTVSDYALLAEASNPDTAGLMGRLRETGFTLAGDDVTGGTFLTTSSTYYYIAIRDHVQQNDTSNGGAVWIKSRDNNGLSACTSFDTVRGAFNELNTTAINYMVSTGRGVCSFNNNGFSVSDISSFNTSGGKFASWSFKKHPKFFDVVRYSGNGQFQSIPHELDCAPGVVMVKATDHSDSWYVWHRSYPNDYILLNSTGTSSADTGYLNDEIFGDNGKTVPPTETNFTVGRNRGVNEVAKPYIAYLFAHDADPNGIIFCGKFSHTQEYDTSVTTPWEPQFLLIKNNYQAADWMIFDQSRPGWLSINSAGAEGSVTIPLSSTGFVFKAYTSTFTTGNYMYMIIRKSLQPATNGASVYNAVTRTGSGSAYYVASGAGFAPDMTIMSGRANVSLGGYQHAIIDRVRRAKEHLQFSSNAAEGGGWGEGHQHNNDGYDGLYASDGSYFNINNAQYIDFHFKRALGFFDITHFTGTGTNTFIPHKLGVTPELIIIKNRNTASAWPVWTTGFVSASGSTGEAMYMDSSSGKITGDFWNGAHTSTYISISAQTIVNGNGQQVVAYLFASLTGISKVGTYTGNGGAINTTGTSQTINCGFTNGARFIMIKWISGGTSMTSGDWFIWDTTRGIVAGNDPHISFNSTSGDVTTDDSVDPVSSGFAVNQLSATNVNVTGATYLYLAIA